MAPRLAPFVWRDVTQVHVVPGVLVVLVVLAVLYAWAQHRVPGWPAGRLVAFLGALATLAVATQSVLGIYDRSYFSDHMIQHLALIMVAGPLLALAAPLDLGAALAAPVRRALDSPVGRALTHPLIAFAVYFVFIPLTHLTGLFDVVLTHPAAHEVEHVAFVAAGYLFFRAAFGIESGQHLHPGLRLVYVMAAVPVDTFTGLALAMSSHNPFPAYRTLAPLGSTPASILANVHLGGAIMWIGGDALMLAWAVPIAWAWVREEDRRTAELDARLDAEGR